MFATWVIATEAGDRLDAEFYRPEYVINSKSIEAFPRLSCFENLRKPNRSITYGVLKPQFVDRGVPLIRNQDFEEPNIASHSVAQIDPLQSEEYKRSIVNAGDLLVTIGGYVGTAAVVPPAFDGANINQHIARVSLNEMEADSYFYWAFIASKSGKSLLQRWVSGSVQTGINLNDLKWLKIPWPSREIQHAIGNKVRKAERLRELAEQSLSISQELLTKSLNIHTNTEEISKNSYYVYLDDLNSLRLDSKYYQPEYLALRHHIEKLAGGKKLRHYIKSVCNGIESRTFVDEGLPYLCVFNLSNGDIDVEGAPRISKHTDIPKKARVEAGDVLVARTGSIGQSIDIIDENSILGPVISSDFIKLIPYNREHSGYLSFFLNSSVGKILQAQILYGAVQPHISQDDLLELPIPLLDDELKTKIGQHHHFCRRTKWQAKNLIEQAKSDVESLIDGMLDEEKLLAEGEEIDRWLEANASPHQNA